MRLFTPFLVCCLALAAAGRFHAEASVREAQSDLNTVRGAIAAEAATEARLRLEVEVLESAGRFEEVNQRTLGMRAPEPEQLTTGEDFAARIGRPSEGVARISPESDLIANAITMTAPEAVSP